MVNPANLCGVQRLVGLRLVGLRLVGQLLVGRAAGSWARRPLAGALPIAFLLLGATFSAAEFARGDDPGWLTGPQLQRRLVEPVGVTWTGRSLRDALNSLSAEFRVATFLDRRIDPSVPIDLSLQDVALQKILALIAAEHNLGMTWLGPVCYFGPAESARDLRTLAALRGQDVRKLPREGRQSLGRLRPLEWPELATPREVLAELGQRYGLSISNLDSVPHDLWPAAKLPAMSLVDQLTLLGAGFDLTFDVEPLGKSIKLVRSPHPVLIDQYYAAGGVDPQQLASAWSRMVPEALIKPHNGQIAVRGRVEDHEMIEAARRGEPVRRPAVDNSSGPAATDKPTKVYSLKVSAPVGQLLRALARQAGIELEMDDKALAEAGIDLNKVVNVDVKEVTLDQLLEQVLAPAGLAYQREESKVRIAPRAASDGS